MFGFMKKHSDKDKDEREKRKKEKKDVKNRDKGRPDKPLTSEELQRLEEARRSLYKNGSEGGAVSYSESSESLGSSHQGNSTRETTPEVSTGSSFKAGRAPPPTYPKPKKGILKDKSFSAADSGNQGGDQGVRSSAGDAMATEENTVANEALSGKSSSLPQPPPISRPDLQKKMLRSNSGSGSSAGGEPAPRTGPPKKPVILSKPRPLHIPGADSGGRAEPTSPSSPSHPSGSHVIAPPAAFRELPPEPPEVDDCFDELIPAAPPSPAEKIYENVDLHLPSVAPPRSLKPRTITLKRLPAGDFGFSLRKGTILERGNAAATDNSSENKRKVIFAEPGVKNLNSGLLPGDRLIEVNGINVESHSREELIEIIRDEGESVTLKVQPIPELSELSMRSGVEGEELSIAEQSVSTGTLQRSGSMRYKTRQAKTDKQLAEDKAWLAAERVWLVHKGGFAAARVLRGVSSQGSATEDEEGSEVMCKVKLDDSGATLDVHQDDVEKANPPQFDRVEDLATLRYANESSVLHTLRQRYGSNLVHSHAGAALLVVNPMHPLSIYSEKVISMFRGCKSEDMPPHIYASAQTAYRHMLASRQDQAILLLGRSGAGKSTSVRHLMHYYSVAAGSVNNVLTVERLNALFTVLDAFGNSRTVMNTSATRYTSLVSLDFDHAGAIATVSIQALMFEKTRVCRRPEGEPTFHVFYQMLAGIDSALRKELMLENMSDPNLLMTPLQRPEDRQKATQAWGKILHSLHLLAVSEAETRALTCALAAIYHLGVAGATMGGAGRPQFERPEAAQRAASVLGLSTDDLARAVFSTEGSQSLKRGYSNRSGGSAPAAQESMSALECVEGFVTGLYGEVFHVIVSLVNRALSSNVRTNTSILLVDAPGLQNPSTCGRSGGATLTDLCHNYVNERLHLLYHHAVFTAPQDLYAQENISCELDSVTSSPQPMVTLIDKQPALVGRSGTLERTQKRDEADKGLLWLLDEEAIFPGATDASFLQRFLGMHKAERKTLLLRRGDESGTFTLNHSLGTSPVLYHTDGWLRACRENPVARNVANTLLESKREEVNLLFSTFRAPGMPSTVSGSLVGLEAGATGSLRRVASMRRTFTSPAAALKRRSLALQVKFQVDSLVETLRRCKLHFVHCLLPQHNAGLSELRQSALPPNKSVPSEALMLSVPLLRAQLRAVQLIDAIRIHRQGFPENLLFADFRQRYEVLLPADQKPSPGDTDHRKVVERMLTALDDVPASVCRLGLSRVFLRPGVLATLEDAREQRVQGRLTSLQAVCRGYLARRHVQKLRVQHTAVACIQRNVRKLQAVQDWPWWRLYVKIRPLLNVHRTEEELRDREVELEQLRLRLEKLEKERNEYKLTADRLDNKLSELSADLADEHGTSQAASEILEAEQAERRRLERECRELTNELTDLQKKHTNTERDLYEAQMLAAQLEGELAGDELDGGDSLYRERLERLRRETDARVKRLEKEREEEQEQWERENKHAEKRLQEAVIESEEQSRQAASWRKRNQRTAQDHADTQRHLEEQLARNADLEKKQRRFDSELGKVSEQLKDERAVKDRLQRERDELSADKYAVEQKLKDLQVDLELSAEKSSRLEKELDDVMTSRADATDSVALRRLKAELESKLKEQEEELDEQAATIQHLEQAKLRLEMATENVRKKHVAELEEKEAEVEEVRATWGKKLRALESQLEEEHADKQVAQREKRDLERKLQEMGEAQPAANRDAERRLRRDLKRTKALLADAQLVIKKHQEGAGGRAGVKQLRNLLDDSEYALQAAIKARKSSEMELAELQHQVDDLTRARQESEHRVMSLTREKAELLGRLDDQDEDSADVMRKYSALVKQQSTDQILLTTQSQQIEELQAEIQTLRETVAQLESRVQFYTDNFVPSETVFRLESRIRDLESRFDLEETSRKRAETTLTRLKEQHENSSEERERLAGEQQRAVDAQKRAERAAREAQDELLESQRKEGEASARKAQLESRLESLEGDLEQSQSDLRLAFKRIADLQNLLEEQMMHDSGDSDPGDSEGDDDSDLDDLDSLMTSSSRLRNVRHASASFSPRTGSSAGSVSNMAADEIDFHGAPNDM